MPASAFILYALISLCLASSLPRDGSLSQRHEHQQQQVLGTGGPTNRQARGFVALGDSYSAGIGTGTGTGTDDKELPSEGDCRRGVHAYPQLIHRDLTDATGLSTAFQWLSCAGAATADILSGGGPGAAHEGQVDLLNTSQPLGFATLSVGGNDLGFFDVMNACVFRFYSLYSGTCGAALDAAAAAVRGPAFEQRLGVILHEVLDGVSWEKRPRFSVTVTGYARFFDADTPGCDDMSLGVWHGGPKLSRDVRGRMNALVGAANDKLRRTVASVEGGFRGASPRVVFVDYDDLFEGHRFCEPGVLEPAYNRTDSWFFLVGGPDNARNETTWPKGANGDPDATRYQRDQVLSPLSPLVDPHTCLSRARARGDWGELALCYMAMAKHRDPSLRPAYHGITAQGGMWWVPTYYGKTFHPRTLGHEAIRDRIYHVWEEHGL
ncbi:putative esterase family protein [Diaporthe ampelina]|uniref:Putative esterase family protein n=1 Tax=Diaporthe ampelina TaxID=1214573 RepID=A0A0G2I1A6_9PEZI|nr:putative esterase family protein [Diaporthe ampelina]